MLIYTPMNAWDKRRKSNGWNSGMVEWTDNNETAYISVVFSWKLQDAYMRAAWLKQTGHNVIVGGPAAAMNPGYFDDVAHYADVYHDAVAMHNPHATFTSRGCIRQCKFCAVPKTEGHLIELNDWPVRPIICDNNLLACSRSHFDNVIDKLKTLTGVDFNQGLDARLLTKHHADRIAELDLKMVRLAWDHSRLETQFLNAYHMLRDAGIPKQKISVYVLIGYNDTPADALYRLQSVWGLGSFPNPMRYQPLDAQVRNQFVGEHWTDAELKRYTRYWSNLRHLSGVPFAEFRR
jgi:hypothetical protein